MGVSVLNRIDGCWKWSDDPGEDLMNVQDWEEVANKLGLSMRERQVCRLLFCGRTRNEIAEQLNIKSRTVRQYMEQVHVKMRVRNRVGLVLRIIQVRDSLR